jgi:hypothetical protein
MEFRNPQKVVYISLTLLMGMTMSVTGSCAEFDDIAPFPLVVPFRPIGDVQGLTKSAVDEANALASKPPGTPATVDYVRKVLELARVASMPGDKTQLVRRADQAFESLTAKDQDLLLVPFIEAYLRIDQRGATWISKSTLVRTVLPNIQSGIIKGNLDLARALSRLRAINAASIPVGLRSAPFVIQSFEVGIAAGLAAARLYDDIEPKSQEAFHEHFELGRIYNHGTQFVKASKQFEIAESIATALPDGAELKQKIALESNAAASAISLAKSASRVQLASPQKAIEVLQSQNALQTEFAQALSENDYKKAVHLSEMNLHALGDLSKSGIGYQSAIYKAHIMLLAKAQSSTSAIQKYQKLLLNLEDKGGAPRADIFSLKTENAKINDEIAALHQIKNRAGRQSSELLQALVKLELDLVDNNLPNDARFACWEVDQVFARLSGKRQMTAVPSVVFAAAKMPSIPIRRGGCIIGGPLEAGAYPMLDYVLPFVYLDLCPDKEALAAPLNEAAHVYVDSDCFFEAKPIADAAYYLAKKYNPESVTYVLCVSSYFQCLLRTTSPAQGALSANQIQELNEILSLVDRKKLPITAAQRALIVSLRLDACIRAKDKVSAVALYGDEKSVFLDPANSRTSDNAVDGFITFGAYEEALSVAKNLSSFRLANNHAKKFPDRECLQRIQDWADHFHRESQDEWADKLYGSFLEIDEACGKAATVDALRNAALQFIRFGKPDVARKYALRLKQETDSNSDHANYLTSIAENFMRENRHAIAEEILAPSGDVSDKNLFYWAEKQFALADIISHSGDYKGAFRLCATVREAYLERLNWAEVAGCIKTLSAVFEHTEDLAAEISLLQLVRRELTAPFRLSLSLEYHAVSRRNFDTAIRICRERLAHREKNEAHPIQAYKHFAELLKQAGKDEESAKYEKLLRR